MSTIRELHNKAMILLQEAIVSRHNGDDDTANKIYKEAFILESQAADLVSKKENSEPTRSILYRSAASLAYQAGEFDSSLNLIGKCLSGEPNVRVKEEIKILYENVNLAIYLNQKKITLTDEEIDFHLTGNFISYGLIFYKDFVNRIESLQQIIKRTTQRMSGQAYSSRVRSDILIPALHSPSGSGSFSITLRIAYNKQRDMIINPKIVVDEIMDCFDFVQNRKEEELFLKIKDEKYYSNFISNSKIIAPDGESITNIDFISKRKEVNFSRTSSDISLHRSLDKESEKNLEYKEISGTLDLASSKRNRDEFAEITNDNGETYKIKINEGLEDFVKNFYKSKVSVKGLFDGTFIYMDNMEDFQ